MINDLSHSNPGALTADILIIGGGVAGLLAATRAARMGLRVVVAESGGLSQSDETHPLNVVEQTGDIYNGAARGRFRCLGGTSTRWGGTMLPFQPTDFTNLQPDWDAEWPVTTEHFAPWLDEVEELFKLTRGPFNFPDMMRDADGAPSPFVGRLPKWPPFRARNIGVLLTEAIEAPDGPEVWLNATATRFNMDAGGRLRSVMLDSGTGNRMTVTAPETIIAAGAIESTRLLLLMDAQHDNRIFTPDDVLGRYFHDHIASRVGRLTDIDQPELNRIIGFRFEPGGNMRNLRFEPTGALRETATLPAGYTYFEFADDSPNGFLALREIFRKLQRRSLPGFDDALALAKCTPWLARAVWWRYREKRLLFPDKTDLNIITMIEQQPRADNRIDLSPNVTDSFGMPAARIQWRIGEADAANLVATAHAFTSTWNSGQLARYAKAELDLPKDPRAALASGGGFFHPGGTVRMAKCPSDGVVDTEMRTFRVPNITVLSTATFPTGGGSNPTMTLMMATFRAVDRLAEVFKVGARKAA